MISGCGHSAKFGFQGCKLLVSKLLQSVRSKSNSLGEAVQGNFLSGLVHVLTVSGEVE